MNKLTTEQLEHLKTARQEGRNFAHSWVQKNSKDPVWLLAFSYYNFNHEKKDWLGTSCPPCYDKVLHFCLTNA